MIIRPAKLEDAELLHNLIVENANFFLKPHYTELQLHTFIEYYSVGRIQDNFKNQEIFCAIENDQIVGTIALDNDYIVGFYTRVGFTGKGIGKQLLQFLEKYAGEKNLKKLYLSASPEGVSFYLKFCWNIEKQIVIEYLEVPFEETLMWKNISEN